MRTLDRLLIVAGTLVLAIPFVSITAVTSW
jgi:hypothetical protein